MHRLRREEGQIVPLLLVGLLVALLSVSAIVLDVGRAYLVKRQLQSTADAAALAAATGLPDTTTAASTADAYGASGKNPVPGMSVTQTIAPWCLKSIAYCYGGTPGTQPTSGKANGVVVRETTSVPTTFAKLVGINSIDVHAKATACGSCAGQPLDIALVIDRTGSMSGHMAELRSGVENFLKALDPRFDYVTLLVLPPLSGGGTCSVAPASSSFPIYPGHSYPAGSDDTYTVVRNSNDYKNADGTLNTSATLVGAIECMQPAGSTAYLQALKAAQRELTTRGSGRPDVKRVIVFESDGAANTAADSAFDTSKPTAKYASTWTVYQPASGKSDEVLRPCGSAVDYANNVLRPSGTIVFTVGYAVGSTDTCYEAPHASVPPGATKPVATGYQTATEGISAPAALQNIADPGNWVDQSTAGDLTAAFAKIADKLMGARIVPDSEAS